ncbi:MAG: transcriptional regulator NrdR, partial [bacterium]
ERLKKFDKVAYIRFASVYRQFEDVETFQNELKGLMGRKKERTQLRSKRKRDKH